MSRAALEDRICYLKRELKELEETETNCLSCDRRRHNTNHCVLHGEIPSEYTVRTDCPDWELQLVPF